MASSKRSVKKSVAKRPTSSQAPSSAAHPTVRALVRDLSRAIKQRKYNEAERIGHLLLDSSLSEEADSFIHDIISSATTIHDAEDEIRYQLDDLKSVLDSELDQSD